MNFTRESRAVAKAIKLLDEKGPPDWRERVNVDRLAMDSVYDCVLGQIYATEAHAPIGAFRYGLAILGARDLDSLPSGVFASNAYLPAWKRQLRKGG